jgi:hypothetical protein
VGNSDDEEKKATMESMENVKRMLAKTVEKYVVQLWILGLKETETDWR